MNILLLNPFTGLVEMSPPLGLRYIAGMLKHNGFNNVVGVDLHVDSMSKFESVVIKVDMVGIHTVSKIFPEVVKLARKAKELNPKIKVIIGGPHASLEPEEVISAEPVDFVVVGEGEYAFLELVSRLSTDGELSDIKNIWYKSNGSIKQNSPGSWIKRLDDLPFPDFELFNMRRYNRLWSFYRNTTLVASRSCPYSCTNCQPALREIMGPYRQRSVENVVSEIRFLKARYKVRHFSFVDNTFTVNRKWVVDFCDELIRQNLKITWICAGTVGAVDRELMALMKRAGCTAISFGVESGSQHVLDNILHKKLSVEKAREVIREASELKLRTHCYFMLGIPGETKEQTWETVELAKTINCDSLLFSIVVPQPHIALNKICEEKGWILPYQLSDLERPGTHSFSMFTTDEWLGRSSLFKTDEWGPEFLEEIKPKIVADFGRMGWSRQGFIFTNVRKVIESEFLRYVGSEVNSFLRDFDLAHVKWALKAITYKAKSLLGF